MSAAVSLDIDQPGKLIQFFKPSPLQVELARNSVCAGTAAALATGAFNPLDTLRVRWQLNPIVSSPANVTSMEGSLLGFAREVAAREGFVRGLWRPGVTATMFSMGTSCGVRMGCYPFLRDWVTGDAARKTPAVMFGTGLVAGGMGYWLSCPFFQAKTRLQTASMLSPSNQAGLASQLREVFSSGGISALWRGASPLVVRGALFSAGQTLGYDGSKTVLSQRSQIMQDGPLLHALGSVVAAFFATVFSAPADFLMTRYQAAPQIGMSYKGPLDCMLHILRAEGPSAFYRGWLPYFGRITPVFLTFHPLFEQLRLIAGLSYFK